MTSTIQPKRIALCLILFFTALGVTLTNATTENNYKNDTTLLPRIFETTHTENGYKANIIINPYTTGIYAKESNFNLDLTINPQGTGGAFTENNYQLDLIPEKTFPDIPDPAITDITLPKTIVGKGFLCDMNITVTNQELYYETFYVTLRANTTAIETQTVTLTGKDNKISAFTWNTTGFAYGNYTVSSYATPVPGETFTGDNTYIDGTVLITIPGDANGDRIVDIFDIGTLSSHWYPGPPIGPLDYHPNSDINNDLAVDIFDIGITSAHWGESW